MDATIEIKIIVNDDEKEEMHYVVINRISKIFWEINQTIPLKEQKWILYQLAVRNTKILKQRKSFFKRRKPKVNDDWLSSLISEYELNIGIEFGDGLWCTLKAEESRATYTYDVNGNQIEEVNTKNHVTTANEYDADNRLSKATITTATSVPSGGTEGGSSSGDNVG